MNNKCPACGHHDNVTTLELTLSCNVCKEQSVLWDKEMKSSLDYFDLKPDKTGTLFEEAIKRLAHEKAKYIEDYIKFWLAVNAGELLKYMTPQSFAKDYHLLEKHFEDGAVAYQMLPHNQIMIDIEEYKRLKEIEAKYEVLCK